MSQLFAPFSIKGMRLANRLVRSATFDSLAQADGEVTEAQIELYRELAKGGAGLLVVGFICAHQSGRASQRQLCLDRDEHIPGLARLCQAVHGHGGKVAAQMVHSGREGARYRALVGGEPALGPLPAGRRSPLRPPPPGHDQRGDRGGGGRLWRCRPPGPRGRL